LPLEIGSVLGSEVAGRILATGIGRGRERTALSTNSVPNPTRAAPNVRAKRARAQARCRAERHVGVDPEAVLARNRFQGAPAVGSNDHVVLASRKVSGYRRCCEKAVEVEPDGASHVGARLGLNVVPEAAVECGGTDERHEDDNTQCSSGRSTASERRVGPPEGILNYI
jgi:hypothetical protein